MSHRSLKFPRNRKTTLSMLESGRKHLPWSASFEVDMTNIQKLREAFEEKHQYHLTYTPILVKGISLAIRQHMIMNTHLFTFPRVKLVEYDDIDCALTIEKSIDNEFVVALLIIRQADKRPLIEIAKEIEHARTAEPQELECYREIMRYNKYVPLFQQRVFSRAVVAAFPKKKQEVGGTFGISTNSGLAPGFVEMWPPPIPNTTTIGVSRLIRKPVGIGEEIVLRPIIKLCLLVDHQVVDGSPGGRFALDCKKTLERAEFIEQELQ